MSTIETDMALMGILDGMTGEEVMDFAERAFNALFPPRRDPVFFFAAPRAKPEKPLPSGPDMAGRPMKLCLGCDRGVHRDDTACEWCGGSEFEGNEDGR